MSKLFGSCCHRQPNSREWAKETTPFVWEPAWAEADELSLRPVNLCSLSLNKGKPATEHTQCLLLSTATSQAPHLRELTREVNEWHFCTTTVAWHSSVIVKSQGRIPGRVPCVPRSDTKCIQQGSRAHLLELLSHSAASVQLPTAYRHQYPWPWPPVGKSLSVCSNWSLPSHRDSCFLLHVAIV